jgi:hypothetical protein
LIGFSGGRILTALSEKAADKITKENLTKALQNMLEK